MRIAWEHVDALDVVTIYFKLNHLITTQLALLNQSMTSHYNEELPLGVMPVLSLCNSWLRDIDRNLTGIQGMNQLSETTSIINVHLQGEGYFLLGEITEISRIEFLSEAISRNLWYHQRLWLFSEALQQLYNLTQRYFVGNRTIAIPSCFDWLNIQTIELALVALTLQNSKHFIHKVINIQQLQLY